MENYWTPENIEKLYAYIEAKKQGQVEAPDFSFLKD